MDKKLIDAARKGNLELVQSLFSQGVNIHAYNDSALICSAMGGYLEIVKYLVEKGSDIHTNDDESLRFASLNGQFEVIQYFLYDCKMKIKKETKNWLIENRQRQTLQLIEKRDSIMKIMKNYEKLNQNIIQKDSIDNLGKKVKI